MAIIRLSPVHFLLLGVLFISPPIPAIAQQHSHENRQQIAGSSAYPPDQTGLSAIAVHSMPMPEHLQQVADPALNKNSLITRVGDQLAYGTINQYLSHQYSLDQVWNADESLIALTECAGCKWNTVYLLDGTTGKYLRTVHPGAQGGHAFRWSNVNPDNAYGISSTTVNGGACNDTNRMVVWHPKSDIASSPALTLLHTFTQYDSYADTSKCARMNFGEEKGQFSNDDSLGIVAGWSSAKNSWGMTTFKMTKVNTSTPTVTEIATYWFGPSVGIDPAPSAFHAAGVMPKGDGIWVLWNTQGPALRQGLEWYSPDFKTIKHISNSNGHFDVGLDVSGNEAVIMACGQPGGASTNTCDGVPQSNGAPFIAEYHINDSGPTGQNITLYPQGYPLLTQSVHISCRNQFQRPGWCYVSDMTNDPSRPVGYEQIYAIKLDAFKTVEVFGVNHGSYNSCSNCNQRTARGVPSHNGTKILFASDWGGGASAPVYDYILQWSQAGNIITTR